jgi:DNA-binding response OmpR family regulator
VLRVGALEFDLIAQVAKRGDHPIDLRPREFRLLKCMMQRSDQSPTRVTLLKEASALQGEPGPMAAIEISCREQKNTFWRVILLIHSAKSSAPQISLLNPI